MTCECDEWRQPQTCSEPIVVAVGWHATVGLLPIGTVGLLLHIIISPAVPSARLCAHLDHLPVTWRPASTRRNFWSFKGWFTASGWLEALERVSQQGSDVTLSLLLLQLRTCIHEHATALDLPCSLVAARQCNAQADCYHDGPS